MLQKHKNIIKIKIKKKENIYTFYILMFSKRIFFKNIQKNTALTGNRTRAICLEGKYSTSILLTLSQIETFIF